MKPDPQILAHRGASGWYPEGTELALRKAVSLERDGGEIKGGADVLEIDLRVSHDGHLFLFHDEDFEETAGKDAKIDGEPVGGKGIEELERGGIKQLNAGAVFNDGEFAGLGLRFLELEEAFAMFPDQRFNIEMKGEWESGSLERLHSAIQDASLEAKVVLASQNTANLSFFREKRLRTSASRNEFLVAMAAATAGLGLKKPTYNVLQAWFPRFEPLARRIVSFFRDRNVETHFWTVNKRKHIDKAVASGAAGIISDFPGRVYEELVKNGFREPV